MSKVIWSVKNLRYAIKGLKDSTLLELSKEKITIFKNDIIKPRTVNYSEIQKDLETISMAECARKHGVSRQAIFEIKKRIFKPHSQEIV